MVFLRGFVKKKKKKKNNINSLIFALFNWKIKSKKQEELLAGDNISLTRFNKDGALLPWCDFPLGISLSKQMV